MANTEFRSPLRKLVAFFQASRDNWKEKCQQVKYQLKLLKRRFENLQKNRNLWQQRYREAATQREQLQAQREHLHDQNQKLQARLETLSKKGAIAS
ncbi:MAG: hypothetical protein IH991_15420 [Planctomycetes bacterium]|nr:hypothetical protein [Planctomycetota bacterium]